MPQLLTMADELFCRLAADPFRVRGPSCGAASGRGVNSVPTPRTLDAPDQAGHATKWMANARYPGPRRGALLASRSTGLFRCVGPEL